MARQRKIANQEFKQKTAVICGGSKGIGRETAKKIARAGGSLCLIARGEEELKAAVEEVKGLFVSDDQFVDWFACDTTDYDSLEPLLNNFVMKRGTPDYLINVVGIAYPEYIQKLTFADFKQNMDVNYLGQVAPTLIMLPHFIKAQKGHIVFFSSMLGFIGMMGYATYAPSKFALVGLAESVRHELKPHNIDVSVFYPPDTETPGYEIENLTKPPEAAIITETAKIFTADKVAEAFISGLLKKRFHILMGEAYWIWPVAKISPRLAFMILDRDYAKARKKLGKL